MSVSNEHTPRAFYYVPFAAATTRLNDGDVRIEHKATMLPRHGHLRLIARLDANLNTTTVEQRDWYTCNYVT